MLVSTSIGEEGLDIGEVDLIVCYDAQKTPIRMVGIKLFTTVRRISWYLLVATYRTYGPQSIRYGAHPACEGTRGAQLAEGPIQLR